MPPASYDPALLIMRRGRFDAAGRLPLIQEDGRLPPALLAATRIPSAPSAPCAARGLRVPATSPSSASTTRPERPHRSAAPPASPPSGGR
jgi:hypothetical protein